MARENAFLDSYKVSRYNIVSRADDGAVILYNSLTGARALLPPGLLEEEQLVAIEAEAWRREVPLPEPELRDQLQELGFFVPAETDELSIQLSRHHDIAINREVRRVTVVLTRKCNLGCNYCYQDKELADPRANMGRIVAHLRSQVEPGGSLMVTWFGGEPLLRLSLIRELTDEIRPYCREVGASYTATISSNGVLLDEERVQTLLDLDVKFYQITLDGPPDIQEKRRPSLNRKPTYDTIVANVGHLLEGGARVNIKVVIDRENWQRVPELFRDLARRGLLHRLQLAIQETEGKFAAATYDPCFGSFEEYTAAKMELFRVLYELGYPIAEPTQKGEFCAATSPYSTIIDMSGAAFRCATEPANEVGSVGEDGKVQLTRPDYEQLFTTREGISDPLCRSCKVLPICGGGCTLAAEKMARRGRCSFFRTEIRNYLALVDAQERGLTVQGR
jgi:uncharacterized protein